MKLQDLLVPLTIAFLTTWGIQYFFITRHLPTNATGTVQSGQGFHIPSQEQMLKPLNTEIDFSDEQLHIEPAMQDIITPLGKYQFATAGGGLYSMSFDHKVNKHSEWLQTLQIPIGPEHEHAAFLLALDQRTPYAYHVVDTPQEAGSTQLTYAAQNQDCTVQKQFVIHEDTNRIDLTITIEPHAGKTVQPRIFVPAPQFTAQGAQDVFGFVYNDQQSIKKYKRTELENTAWASPALIGMEDRYFIHALVADKDHFVERAYFKIGENSTLSLILESVEIQEKKSWTLSFYCGPKRLENMNAVDSRLDETLDYGWFAPLSKMLLALLKVIHEYVHNYGWAIIILTLLLRLIMVPFTLRQEQSNQRRAEFAKKTQYIEQKYKHDRELLAKEKMELMKKHGVVSDAMGCLPNLLMLPVLIGFNRVLNNSIDLFHAPFIWIPDLSTKDPYYILPALIGVSMLLSQADNADPRQRVALIIMAFVVAGITAYISAGLALFICFSTLASVAQTKIQRILKW